MHMSKKKFADLSMEERANLAANVKALRQSAEMTQVDLAKAAGVTRQTIIGLESGSTVPQAEVLERVLRVFGAADDPAFSGRTELWLTMIGSLIEAIPETRREQTVDAVIRTLGAAVRAGVSAHVGATADDEFADEDYDVTHEDLTRKDVDLIAMKGKRRADELPHAE